METRFDYENLEKKIYESWEKSGLFSPDTYVKRGLIKKSAKSFSIVLPPPNVTGTLHMGHAAMLAIEDIMVRFSRMKGLRALWLPGTDHAAIATQSVVEKKISKEEGKSRHDLGREAFLERVKTFAKESHDTIANQVRRMGASVDWTREAYTLDEERNFAVRTAFKKMYDEELIYRGKRIINWDPKGQTTISDDEIIYVEEKTNFYYFQYGPFVIGTARPETKFGDKYVVMHPKDKRYAKYKHGDQINLEWINGPIVATIVKDEAIDMKFGTGVMTITPWHSIVDFDIAKRHNLDVEQIIDERGKLLPIAGEFTGEHITKARPLIVEKLRAKGLLVKEEPYTHQIATAERTGAIVEPQIKLQWFIDVNKPFVLKHSKIKGIQSGSKTTLKEVMRKVIKNNQIEIIPERFEKIYFNWIDNLRDWCISRQIWFGHRIPVWYCQLAYDDKRHTPKCDKPVVSIEPPVSCPGCGGKLDQDSDTLDTWFSSGLWTFSTLGWPKETEDLMNYHPTSVLETGYDIIFFWVARMILMSGFLLGDIPFHKVYLHGLVRDAQGRKMSKSLGNIMDPLEMINKYGADATRLSLIIGAGPGNDTKLSEDKVRGYRNFTTKVWNASRFVIMNYKKTGIKPKFTAKDKKYLRDVELTKKKVGGFLDKYDFNQAGEVAYHYFWHTFADKVLEEIKPRLSGNNEADRAAAQETLLNILRTSLKMLHPFVPFVTEEIWGLLPETEENKMLIAETW